MARAVFLDRDGTIGGDGWYCHPDEFMLYPESIPAIKLLNQHGWKVIVVTNQTHIAYGEITLKQVDDSFHRIQMELAQHGAQLDGWYICPHGPYEDCICKKPKPFMLHQAAEHHGIDLSQSFMIGDLGITDMIAAEAAGCKPILVLTGLGHGSWGKYRHEWAHIHPEYVAQDVLDAARYIIQT
jgi:histidinol-phosphate phosphatase family protein